MAEKKELSERDKRLKAALRDNLRRRKTASRKATSDTKQPEKSS
ncbi:hypothetical protein RYZ27_05885 [Hyphomonas sp. FCG-A18]|jgi:hypothetical protein|nr:hypothetical protein RYZ27_05885 [Hyphomonas sp. FCG-A18]